MFVMLVPLTVAQQSPLRVVLVILVVTLYVLMNVELQTATGFPAVQKGGYTLSLNACEVTQHEQGLASVLVNVQPHCCSGRLRSLII